MALVEIARFDDVHEAELAAAFLRSRGLTIWLGENHQTTVDPLMQRALGIRLLGPAPETAEARALLARAQAGEFLEELAPDDAPVAALDLSAPLRLLAMFWTLLWPELGLAFQRGKRPAQLAVWIIFWVILVTAAAGAFRLYAVPLFFR